VLLPGVQTCALPIYFARAGRTRRNCLGARKCHEACGCNSVGNTKLRMSPSTRMSATSVTTTLKILESSAHTCWAEVQRSRFCSIDPKGVGEGNAGDR